MSFFRTGNSSSSSSTSGDLSSSDSGSDRIGHPTISDIDRALANRSNGTVVDVVFERQVVTSSSSSRGSPRSPARNLPATVSGIEEIDFEGERLQQRMEHEIHINPDAYHLYGSSYPPRSVPGRVRKRCLYGFEKNIGGDFPEAPVCSSAPLHNDPGYNRAAKFPVDSTMGLEFHSYKQYAKAAAEGAGRYKDLLKAYETRNAELGSTPLSRDQHTSLGVVAWHSSLDFRR